QLGAGQSITDSFTAVSFDGTASQVVTVTIHRSEERRVGRGVITGSVTENVAVVSNHLSTGGALTIADVDQRQSSFTAQVGTAGDNGYGTFTLATNGSWTYTASNTQSAIQQLGATDSITDSFTAVSFDGTASQLVTVTIHGTNDVPVIGAPTTEDRSEDVAVNLSGKLATNGELTIADVDQSQSTFTAHASVAGTYGTFTLAANGVWTYTALNSQTAIQQLGAGESIADSFTAVSSDGTASQLVTVTINGTNDIAVIGTPTGHDVTEDVAVTAGYLTAIGTISISDVDTGEGHFQTIVSGAGTNLGSLLLAANGSYTYSVLNSAAQTVASTHVDTFTVTAADGTTQLVSFTIHSTNDAPVIQDHVVSKVANISADGGQLVFSGGFFFGDRDFTVSDPDGPQFGIAITSLDNANGMWEYQLAGTTTWTAIKLAAGEALLLSANDKVRFNGAANAPIEVMTFKAWDGSDGLAAG